MELSSTKQVMKGIDGSPYNCLCFCEVVGNRVELPGTKFLPFSVIYFSLGRSENCKFV
jgi:hypothetical protein